jgi:membrane associated rhomboid family serine protease
MFFPIGDDQIKGGAYPFFSYTFLVLNIVAFLYQISLTPEGLILFLDHFSTIPSYIGEGHHLGTLLTSMFLHGSIIHLLGNMIFLWVFADNIEATIGNVTFVLFYLAGGVLASLAHVYFNVGSDIPSLGASGAISAVMEAYLIMFLRSRIKVPVFLIIFIRQVSMTALAFLGLWIVMQVVSTFQNMSLVEESGVAWFAHLGGLIFGLVMGLVFKDQARQMTISSY